MASQPLPFDFNDDGITLSGEQDTIPRAMLDNAPSIEKLRRRFDEARGDPGEGRIKSQKYRDYYDGPKQLDSDIRETLRLRGQPPIYTNRIRPAVNGVLGVLEASRSDPRAYPRNPDDDEAADVATKSLRYIADECTFGDTKMDVAEDFFIEGTGAALIEVVDNNRIVATQIRWEEFYADPYSRRSDFGDARYMGVAKWMDAAQIREKWRVRINEIGDPMIPQGAGILSDTWNDRPESLAWIDRRRRRVMLVEEYAIEKGKWMRCVYIAAGILEYDVSPYLDEKGRPCCPIEAVSCYVDRDNRRYGMVADMIPIQDEVNASRSRSLHLMNSRQVQCVDDKAPPVNADEVKREAAAADGTIPMGWQLVNNSAQLTGNLERMVEAKGEIERMGPSPQARDLEGGTAVSGRSRLVAQQAGLSELARPLGRFSAWELRCYRQMWNRAKQYWTDPMWIRVTDEVKAPEFLQINEPVMGMVMQPVAGPDGQPALDPMTGQPQMMPAIGQVGTNRRVAELDVDIILDTTPDTINLQAEVFADLKEAVVGGLDIFGPQFEVLLEMSPLANKADVLERLKAKKEELQRQQAKQAQQAAEQQQKAEQIGMATAAADIENKQANTQLTVAKTEQTQADTWKNAITALGLAGGEDGD